MVFISQARTQSTRRFGYEPASPGQTYRRTWFRDQRLCESGSRRVLCDHPFSLLKSSLAEQERGRTDLDGNLIDDDYDPYCHQPVSLAGSMHDASPYYHDPSPPLPGSSMSYADTGVYGSGGVGVTRNPSTGASTFLSGHSDDGGMAYGLGGSRAFDSRPDSEMMEMTETRPGGLGRSGSGRLL